MALAVTCRFDFLDQKGKASFTKVRIPTGFTISQMTEFVQGAAQVIADLSVGTMTRASFCVGLDLSTATIKAAAGLITNVADKGFFQFLTSVAGFRKRMSLAAIDENFIVAGSDAYDDLDPDVAAFEAAMENGITVTGGTISPTDARGNDVVSTQTAVSKFRSS